MGIKIVLRFENSVLNFSIMIWAWKNGNILNQWEKWDKIGEKLYFIHFIRKCMRITSLKIIKRIL